MRTALVLDPLAQPFGRGIQHNLAGASDDKSWKRSRRFNGDVEPHPRFVDTLGFDRVFDVLTMLLECLFGIPDHPIRTPVVLQDFGVDESQDLYCGLPMVRRTE